MKNMVRLRVWSFLFVFVALSCGVNRAQSATGSAQVSGADVLSQAEVFPSGKMTVRRMPNGGESEDVAHGVLKTGEVVAVHESMQPVGIKPNAAHRIEHSEFIVVREGTVEFEHDGKAEEVGAGGVIYVAFGTMHRLRNVGNVPAKYVVIAIGGDTKR
ncbi:cupin domain-containing protein [Edaphobacter paludis]|uniref:Cupin domain-containing protein n=1 Tax=Edaphobacter paludis TaxID=3035702 RepID=A0AAU7D4G7_9BACT